jgi:tetratricopeptide (TPR) repeat protein
MGRDEAIWTSRVDAELDNLRAVLAWSVATGEADLALRLVAPLAIAGTHGGYASAPWADVAIGLPGAQDHSLYAEVYAWAGWCAASSGDVERAIRMTNEALELANSQPLEARSMMQVLIQRTVVGLWSGQFHDAERQALEWLRLARTVGDSFYLAGALNTLGTLQLFVGDRQGAWTYLDEAIAVARRVGTPTAIAFAVNMAGELSIATDPTRARKLLEEGLEAATSVDNRSAMGMNIAFTVYLYLTLDDWREAARLVLFAAEYSHHEGDSLGLRGLCLPGAVTVLAKSGAYETAARLYGAVRMELIADQALALFDAAVAALRDELGADRLSEYAAQGARMDDDEIFALVQTEIHARLADGSR